MRHARPDDLDALEPLLVQVRQMGVLVEKSRGVFYRGPKAFLHFHEDSGDLFADLRIGAEFERMRVTTAEEQAHLLGLISAAV